MSKSAPSVAGVATYSSGFRNAAASSSAFAFALSRSRCPKATRVREAIRQANALRPREKRVIDFGWTSEGSLWVAVRLPKDADLQVFHIPTAVSRFVEGRDFPAHTEAGDSCGRIRVQEYGTCYGHAEFLRRAGADEGDILQISFDLIRGGATLALIDDESLEEMSPTL